MSLRHAILGTLSLRPASGYEIKKIFDRGLSLGWNASESQIYRAIHALEKDRLATKSVIEQEGRPSKQQFQITREGLRELDRWLSSGIGPRYEKDPFLLRFFFIERLPPDETLRLLSQRRNQVATEIEENEKVAKQYQDIYEHRHPRRLWWQLQVLGGTIRQQQAQLEWIDGLIAAIKDEVPMSIPEVNQELLRKDE